MEKTKQKLKLRLGPKATAPKFRPLVRSSARYLLLWGGRDSTKSDFVALKLLLDCMQLPYFLCVLIREKQNTIADSQIAALKKVATREGLLPYFRFPQGPTAALEVSCKLNGNRFIGRGTDDMDRVKSVSDATSVWYEEANQIREKDADVLSTSLRTSVAGALIQEIYTFNPDHRGDFKKFWLYKRFFEATGHTSDTTFDGSLLVEMNGQLVRQQYQVLHSTARDNPWAPIERVATYKAYGDINPITGKANDEYLYRVWYEGLWATKQSGNEFFSDFRRAAHVSTTSYVPGLPIIQSWDANAQPYCAMLCAQSVRQPGGDLIISIFKEYALRPPNSGLASTATKFLLDRKERSWDTSDVILTGDASLRARKTGDGNQSNFKDILAAMNPALDSTSANQWPHTNTRVGPSRDFMNYVLRGGLPGVRIQVDPGCTELIADWELAQLGADGGVFKEMHREKDTGLSYQLRGHFSDVGRYLLVTLLKGQYEAFLKMRPQ